MVNIFEYIDFRAYLKAYYNEKKSLNRHYSYELFAKKCGFKNKGFIHKVINGSDKLSNKSCFKISQGLGHKEYERKYFESITFYTQAKEDNNEKLKQIYEEEILMQKRGAFFPARMILKDQHEYYSQWYHSAICTLIDIYKFRGDYAQLSQLLSPPITENQAKKSIALLERLALIAKNNDGIYYLTEKSIWASKEVSLQARNQFHLKCIDLAKKAIDSNPQKSCNIISLTFGISRHTYDEIINDTKTFINTISNRVKNDDSPERVYQYELLLFPLSNDEKFA